MKKPLLLHYFLKSLLALIVFSQESVFAQPIIQWDKTIGSLSVDALNSISQTKDGGYLLAGNGSGNASGDRTESSLETAYWIVKIGPDGSKKWDKVVADAGNQWLRCALETDDEGYLLGGEVEAGDARLTKLDKDRKILWQKFLGGPDGYGTVITAMEKTTDGGYIIGMTSDGDSSSVKSENNIGEYGGRDYWIVKLDAQGNVEWDNTIGGTSLDVLGSVQQTSDGGYIVGGTSRSGIGFDKTNSPRGLSDIWIVKLDSKGIVQWDKTLGGVNFERFGRIIETADKGYIIGASSESGIGNDKTEALKGSSDMWIIRLDNKGTVIWDRSIGGSGNDYCTGIILTGDGGFIAAGNSYSEAGFDKSEGNIGGSDSWIVKISADGTKIWDKTFGGTQDEGAFRNGIISTMDGSFMVGATSWSDISGNKTENSKGGPEDYWVVKFAPEQPSLAKTPIRINAGGPAFTTATKKLFIADQYYAGIDRTSSIASGDILNTSNDVLYRSGRCSPSFSYNIPVANGKVEVILHFAETYFGAPNKKGGAGSRQFHVNMEGSRKLTNFDIYAAAGGAMRAYQTTIPVAVTDGMLNIDFLTGAADLPRISAIEVINTSSTLKPLADAYVRDGSYNATNYGSTASLDVKNNTSDASARRSSYLRFQLPASAAVSSAKLRIYGHNHENTNSISVHAYGVNNDTWTETGIVKNNAPAASTPSLGYVAVNNAYKYYEIDVTSYVKAQQQSGETLVSLLLADPNNRNVRLVFNSKENSANPPQLIVQTSPVVNNNTRLSNEEVSSNLEAEPESSSVYPNPVGKQFTVQVSSKHSEDITLDLLNNAGQSYPVSTAQKAIAGQKAEVDISGLLLSSGIYMLKIKSAAATEVIKLLVTD